jgi:hypothetical protein
MPWTENRNRGGFTSNLRVPIFYALIDYRRDDANPQNESSRSYANDPWSSANSGGRRDGRQPAAFVVSRDVGNESSKCAGDCPRSPITASIVGFNKESTNGSGSGRSIGFPPLGRLGRSNWALRAIVHRPPSTPKARPSQRICKCGNSLQRRFGR